MIYHTFCIEKVFLYSITILCIWWLLTLHLDNCPLDQCPATSTRIRIYQRMIFFTSKMMTIVVSREERTIRSFQYCSIQDIMQNHVPINVFHWGEGIFYSYMYLTAVTRRGPGVSGLTLCKKTFPYTKLSIIWKLFFSIYGNFVTYVETFLSYMKSFLPYMKTFFSRGGKKKRFHVVWKCQKCLVFFSLFSFAYSCLFGTFLP